VGRAARARRSRARANGVGGGAKGKRYALLARRIGWWKDMYREVEGLVGPKRLRLSRWRRVEKVCSASQSSSRRTSTAVLAMKPIMMIANSPPAVQWSTANW